MSEQKYPFQLSAILKESTDKYLKSVTDSVNSQVRNQIVKNDAKSGLYALIFIFDEIAQGLDSYRIVEHLKMFFLHIAQQDPEIGRQAEDIFKKTETETEENF